MNYPKCADKDEPRGSWPWESVLRCLSGQVRRCNHQPGRQRTDRIYSRSGRILLKVFLVLVKVAGTGGDVLSHIYEEM